MKFNIKLRISIILCVFANLNGTNGFQKNLTGLKENLVLLRTKLDSFNSKLSNLNGNFGGLPIKPLEPFDQWSKKQKKAKPTWVPGQRTDTPKSFLRCAILMDDSKTEATGKTVAIAYDVYDCMKGNVDCMVVAHSVLQNLLNKSFSGQEIPSIPDINKWIVYDIKNTQFYLILNKKNLQANKYLINKLDLAKDISVSFPLFKLPGTKIEWNLSGKKLERQVISNLQEIFFNNIYELRQAVLALVSTKESLKFDISILKNVFVTPYFILDSIKSESYTFDKIFQNFQGEEVKKAPQIEEIKLDKKLKLDKAKTGISLLNASRYIKSELPQYNFIVGGHGSFMDAMAGIPLGEIPKILIFLNDLNVKLVALFSCFSGGYNLNEVLKKLKETIKSWDEIDYILAILATGDAPTVQYAKIEPFFSSIETGVNGKKKIEYWLANALKQLTIGNRSFWAGFVVNDPQILVPKVGWVSFLDISGDIQIINSVSLQKSKTEIAIKDKSTILLNVDVIPQKLKISPHQIKYQVTKELIKKFALSPTNFSNSALPVDSYAYPAIVPAGGKIEKYVFKEIEIESNPSGPGFNKIGLLQFIRDAFFISDETRITEKTFFIKTLTGFNDLKCLFAEKIDFEFDTIVASNVALKKHLGEASSPDNLTLSDVLIKTSKGKEALYFFSTIGVSKGYFMLSKSKEKNKDEVAFWDFKQIEKSEMDEIFRQNDINIFEFPYFKSKLLDIAKEKIFDELNQKTIDWAGIKKIAANYGYPDLKDRKGKSIISYAAENGDVDFLKNYSSFSLWTKDLLGNLPLSYALQNANMVKYFLQNVMIAEIVGHSHSNVRSLLKITEEKGYVASAEVLQSHLDLWAAMYPTVNFEQLKKLVDEGRVTAGMKVSLWAHGLKDNSLIAWLKYQVKKDKRYQELITNLEK